jgi:hypothetical protein
MSIVTAFCQSASSLAAAMLGAEPLTIGGGAAVDSVLAEVSAGREFSAIGMDASTTMTAVVRLVDWLAAYPLPAADYIGKRATARNTTFRVGGIRAGAAFVTVELEDVNEVQ